MKHELKTFIVYADCACGGEYTITVSPSMRVACNKCGCMAGPEKYPRYVYEAASAAPTQGMKAHDRVVTYR